MVAKCCLVVRKLQETQRAHSTEVPEEDDGAGTGTEVGKLCYGEGWGMAPSFLPGTLPLGSQLHAAYAERLSTHPLTHLLLSQHASQSSVSLSVCVFTHTHVYLLYCLCSLPTDHEPHEDRGIVYLSHHCVRHTA